ncbi:MAG: LTA synthase family protein [Clostridia bacterium]|nr:LTA synthase family protein [Clostridia bacterium]
MKMLYSRPSRDTEEVLDKKGVPTRRITPLQNVLFWLISAIIVNFILEILQIRSLTGALIHTFTRGHIFIINTALILLSTSLMLVVKRKLFAFALPSVLWLVVGITNTILLSFRPLPISFSDFRLVGEAAEIFSLYLSVPQIIIVVVAIIAIIFGLVWLFIKGVRFECEKKKSLCVFVPVFVLLVAFAVTISIFDFFPRGDETPNEFYERNGFAYNFFKSAGTTGVYTPNGYSDDAVDMLKYDLDEIGGTQSDERPNIIVVQLESFFDMTWMHGITMTDDPVPNFRKLAENGANGYLFVPSYGGGTSNVEFEVLTGMNLDHFTIGESPYYTLLKKNVINDAIAFNMKDLGYTAHAIHNHNALFYERTNAYNNLGFDTFTSIEYMNGLSYNSQSWAKDDVITDEVMSALRSTDGEDFVFAVSVQGHGPYPETVDPNEFEHYIDVQADNLTEPARAGLSYYASTLWEMDKMLGELISELESYDEDCVLVIYGDHLPAVDFSVNYISAPNAYTSEYVIWSNFGLEAEDKDLETYQLMAHMQSLLGFSEGTLTRLHQNYSGREDYQEKLKLLEFSMTNEENTVREGAISYSSHPIRITSITEDAGDILVHGENFTPCSKIMVGDTVIDTIFESPELIITDADNVTHYDGIAVCQMTRDNSTVLETVTLK